MLYPIETLQAGHYLDGPEGYYAGGVKLPGHGLHPRGGDAQRHARTRFHLPASRGTGALPRRQGDAPPRQQGQPPALPGADPARREMYLAGVPPYRGTVPPCRGTGDLHHGAAETSTRFEVPATQVAARVQEMLTARKNPALFLPEPDTESLRKALEADFIPDVSVSGAPGLRYIHRICGGRHIYYFANIGTETAEAGILLRDAVKLRSFDPHTGDNAPFAAEVSAQGTRLQLTLPGAGRCSSYRSSRGEGAKKPAMRASRKSRARGNGMAPARAGS